MLVPCFHLYVLLFGQEVKIVHCIFSALFSIAYSLDVSSWHIEKWAPGGGGVLCVAFGSISINSHLTMSF